jgi:diadenosine tetraphosphatase ApaH/serine/threonine PP2A family protein phosphatase
MRKAYSILLGKPEGEKPLERPRRRWEDNTRVYPKVTGLAAWSENCEWYNYLPLGAFVVLFCESV